MKLLTSISNLVFIPVNVFPSGTGAALPEGHFWPGQRALLVRGESGRGHAPPAAPPLRAAARLPGRRPAAARQRLQFPARCSCCPAPCWRRESSERREEIQTQILKQHTQENHSIYSKPVGPEANCRCGNQHTRGSEPDRLMTSPSDVTWSPPICSVTLVKLNIYCRTLTSNTFPIIPCALIALYLRIFINWTRLHTRSLPSQHDHLPPPPPAPRSTVHIRF